MNILEITKTWAKNQDEAQEHRECVMNYITEFLKDYPDQKFLIPEPIGNKVLLTKNIIIGAFLNYSGKITLITAKPVSETEKSKGFEQITNVVVDSNAFYDNALIDTNTLVILANELARCAAEEEDKKVYLVKTWRRLEREAKENGLIPLADKSSFDDVRNDAIKTLEGDDNPTNIKAEVMYHLLYDRLDFGKFGVAEESSEKDDSSHEKILEARTEICENIAVAWVYGNINNLESAQDYCNFLIKDQLLFGACKETKTVSVTYEIDCRFENMSREEFEQEFRKTTRTMLSNESKEINFGKTILKEVHVIDND